MERRMVRQVLKVDIASKERIRIHKHGRRWHLLDAFLGIFFEVQYHSNQLSSAKLLL